MILKLRKGEKESRTRVPDEEEERNSEATGESV